MKNPQYSLAEISKYLDIELLGDSTVKITGIAPLESATASQISFLERGSYRKFLQTTKAAVVILPEKFAETYRGNKLITDNPYLAYAKISKLFVPVLEKPTGIHSSVVVGEDCKIPASVSIEANCVIAANVTIGENSVIGPGCVIGENTEIGADCEFNPNVTIYHGVKIGNGVILHSGVVIGADGFGMANDNGKWEKIYQIGGVRIGNEVEIGANTCVDRGALQDTVIEDGVKLDNMIQVGHNVTIGAHTVMAGCCGVAGSTKIGSHCMIGGFVAFRDHVTLADQVIITGSSTVGNDLLEPGIYSSGIPAQPHRTWIRAVKRVFQLDGLIKKFKKLEELYDE